MAAEIVLPITEPETEWIRGRSVRKVSPRRDHARVQMEFGSALNVWSRGRGEVGTEWRFRVEPPGEPRRPLVPDIAFVTHARLSGYTYDELQAPPFAPSVAIEILSPGDLRADVASKVDVYLRAGSDLVIVVNPARRTMALHDRSGIARDLRNGDVLRHEALPEFELQLDRFFDLALGPERPRPSE